MKKLLLILLIAFSVRYLTSELLGGPFISFDHYDSMEYLYTSINFNVYPYFQQVYNYHHWYERTPTYVLFLHIIHRELIIQILICSLSTVLMYKMNKLAGWIWCFYPQDIIYSFQYGKEGLLIFCCIAAIYLLRYHRKWLLIAIPLIVIGFSSSANVVGSCQQTMSFGFMNNIWELWKPAFNTSIYYSKWFVYIQAIPYLILMWYFLRNVNFFSTEIFLIILFTIVYSFMYSCQRYREPLMPLIILFVTNHLQKEKNTPYRYWGHYY
ncbi:MAG: hypothetical protein EHM58_00390 [Ignavibacteriae bacterium]|nr:MAG: hypothetical protein EHM58_00390 [Ignavibacteriota bacterium]